MIKNIFILLFFVFMGCNQLVEKTSPLDGIYYILDGWKKFEEENHDRAHDLFSTVLLNNNTQYFTEAYVGLAWNSIYKANSIQGVSTYSEREYQRDISDQYFNLAIEYLNIQCPSSECLPLCQNLLMGRAYNNGYKALESSRQFYDYGLDSANWVNMVNYSNSVLNISDTLLNQCNANYIFDHDELITSASVRILRAQTFVRLSDFNSAKSELLMIDDLNCDFNSQTVVECLNSLDFE